MAAAQFEALEASEVDAVRRWRFDQLVRAGYEDEDAIELAFHLDVDLHLLRRLVRTGCPSGTAVRVALYANPPRRCCGRVVSSAAPADAVTDRRLDPPIRQR